MKVLSLFSGGGLGDYGLELAGMEIIGQVEIDDYCQKILKLRWPDVPKWGDIRDVKGEEVIKTIGRPDLISGGFPCQDLSCAKTNGGQGLDGERSGLWREYYRLICELRPKYVIVENVPTITFRGLGRLLGDLAQIGYDAEWQDISPALFGAPHLRHRFWLVAYPYSDRLVFPVPLRCFAKTTRENKTFWGKYWDEVGAGFTGYEPIQSLEDTKRKAMDKPWLLRVVDGPSTTMDRLKLLGNGQVPQVTRFIGERIMETENI